MSPAITNRTHTTRYTARMVHARRIPCSRQVLSMSVVLTPCLAALLSTTVGCDTMQANRGIGSLSEMFQGPKPQDAVELAIDEYDPDRRYQGTALLANAPFAGEGPYIELFRDAARDEDAGVRQVGVRALGIHGEPEDVPLIIGLLEDDEWLVRMESARALQRLHNDQAINPLIERTEIDNELQAAVRAEAVHALGQYRENRVLQELIRALDDPSLAVNHNSLHSLEVLTGQNLGYEPAAWLAWLDETGEPFKAGRIYTYPGFERDKLWYEWIPFLGPPPNEAESVPVGLQPSF